MLRTLVVSTLLVTLGAFITACGSSTSAPTGCQPHIEVQGSAFWAKELGQSEAWVQQNHRINLWQRPGADRGSKVGALLVGSRALILEESTGAYRVKSPADGSIGWISDIQVAQTLSQDVASREPCTPARSAPQE